MLGKWDSRCVERASIAVMGAVVHTGVIHVNGRLHEVEVSPSGVTTGLCVHLSRAYIDLF